MVEEEWKRVRHGRGPGIEKATYMEEVPGMDEGPCMMEEVTDIEEGQALMRGHAW